jgi:uncharacterized membrane protein
VIAGRGAALEVEGDRANKRTESRTHSVIAFFFNVIVIAVNVNIVAGNA